MKKLLLIVPAILQFALSYGQNCISNTSSLQFSSSYVSLNSNNGLDITDSITIEAWVYSTSWGISSAQNTIVCKHGWSSGEEGYVLRAGGTGELSFNFAGDSAGTNVSWHDAISSTGALQLNTWHHVAATFNGIETNLYVDGSLVGTRNFGATIGIIPSVDYSMKFGTLSDDIQPETRYWNGRIDEIRIWHRVLTPQELTQNMMQHIDTAGVTNLVGYWRLNEATGTTTSDRGSGNNSASVIGATWSTNVPFGAGPPMPVITQAPPFLFSSATSGNQWYVDGNIITGATGTGYQPTQNGTYTVMVTDSNGCSATSAGVVITTLGIGNIEVQNLLIQSGEINGKLRFALSESILSAAELNLFDNTGRLVLSLAKGNVSKEVSLEGLQSGVYFLYLKTTARQFTEKILLH